MSRWIEQCRSAAFHEVAAALHIKRVGPKGYGPCPVCSATTRGDSDKRGAIFPAKDKNGWTCIPCGAKGDVVNLVSYSLCGDTLKDATDDDVARVKQWFADNKWLNENGESGGVELESPEEETPGVPQDELRKFWASCTPVATPEGLVENDIRDFLQKRNWNPRVLAANGVARVTPAHTRRDVEWPAWWPRGRAEAWRLVVPAFDAHGRFLSMQGRAVMPLDNKPKVLWPKDASAHGLIMADRDGLNVLKGQGRADGLIICEGMTDLISVAVHKSRIKKTIAVLGCASGGFQALANVKIPRWLPVYVATDEGDFDGTGDKYAQQVATALSPLPVKRFSITKFLHSR